MSEQCQIGESCVNICTVNSVSVSDILSGSARLPLTEKPAWLQIQKDDDTHNRLYKLITSGGLKPERKLRGHTNLKLMYNMYMKGLLRVDHNGLIIVKHIDTSSSIEYDAISVPKQLYPSIIQSLHIKLEHPSRNQMHRFAHRYFHCVGSTQTIDDIHKSCQVCTSLSTLPKTLSTFSTEKIETLGSHFSADVLVSDNQKIFLCREKLTQFTFSRIIPDEKAETLRSAILDSVLHIMPPSGTTVRVDAAPGLQSINKAYDDIQTDDVLKKHSIKLEIGRTINPNKNPIAENAIKEFRKERLRLNPRGGPISENERIIITRNMNSRIRNRGLSSKEMLLRRDISQNKPIHIEDEKLSNLQFNLRSDVNQKHNIKLQDSKSSNSVFNIGDRVFILKDLSKLHAREEYIITNLYEKNGMDWASLQKFESQFRSRKYEAKLSEIVHVSNNFIANSAAPHVNQYTDSSPQFQGFPSQQSETETTKLQQIIKELSESIPKNRGRPNLKYPDYVKDYPISEDLSQEQFFHGFPTQPHPSVQLVELSNDSPSPPQIPPSHGWIQDDINSDDEDDDEMLWLPFNPKSDLPRPNLVRSSIDSDDETLVPSSPIPDSIPNIFLN